MNMSDCENEGIRMFWKVIMRKIRLALVQIIMEAKEEHTNVIKLVRMVDHTHISISLRTLWNISFPTVLSSPANGFIVIDNDYFIILIYFNDDIEYKRYLFWCYDTTTAITFSIRCCNELECSLWTTPSNDDHSATVNKCAP